MDKKVALLQPLMMRKDYGKTETKSDKDALMIKEIPIEDYDKAIVKKPEDTEVIIEDYDAHQCKCSSDSYPCFLCDR